MRKVSDYNTFFGIDEQDNVKDDFPIRFAQLEKEVARLSNELVDLKKQNSEKQVLIDNYFRVFTDLPDKPFSLEPNLTLKLIYQDLRIGLKNLYVGASAVASGVSMRANYLPRDHALKLLIAFLRLPVPESFFEDLVDQVQDGVSGYVDSVLLLELCKEACELSDGQVEKLKYIFKINSETAKLKNISNIHPSFLGTDLMIADIALEIIKIYEQPFTFLGVLSTHQIEMLTESIINRVAYCLKNNPIADNLSDSAVSTSTERQIALSVVTYKTWEIPRCFEKKIIKGRHYSFASVGITDKDVLSRVAFCFFDPTQDTVEHYYCPERGFNSRAGFLRLFPQEKEQVECSLGALSQLAIG